MQNEAGLLGKAKWSISQKICTGGLNERVQANSSQVFANSIKFYGIHNKEDIST